MNKHTRTMNFMNSQRDLGDTRLIHLPPFPFQNPFLRKCEFPMANRIDPNKGLKVALAAPEHETDITEAERQAILAQEGDRLRVTGRFARMVGHEVRNPLANILLALDQFGYEGVQPPDQQVYLDIMRRNALRINHLITELLHSSRTLEMEMVPGSIKKVLSDSIAEVEDRCELRKVKCINILDPCLGNILMDRATLTIAFTNLLVNAVEAVEDGTGELSVRSRRVKNRIQVTVSDNGKGMSAEDREHIFQPFFSGRKGGMGLGLTEARNIFNAHGVLLTVESELGKGTTFAMLFPA